MSHQSDLISKDILAYLKEHENKELLRFITCGSVDDGKSTLIGRLLHDSKLIYEDHLASIKKDTRIKNSNAEGFDLALLVDGLQAEREQGITIDVAYRYFSTKRRKFIIADTPGHEQYTRNMATGASSAELAIILIDAVNGVMTQTKRHSFIVSLLGIKKLLIAVNKMDLVSYSQERYGEIKADYQAFCGSIGIKSPVFIPISALNGDNVVEKSVNMPWYQGSTLMELLETVPLDYARNLNELRFPVQYVNRPDQSFRGFCGTVSSGDISVGEKITVLPSMKTTSVKSIITFDGELEKASAGQAVTITTTEEVDISRGDMIVSCGSVPEISDCFNADVVWMSETPSEKNRSYYVKRASTLLSAYIDEIYYKTDINTMQQHQSTVLRLNEIGYARINLSKPIAYDVYNEHRDTGSFIIIDRQTNNTVACGMIREKQTSKNVMWHEHKVSAMQRTAIKNHRPSVIWLTGLSGSGKSTIANGLESLLNGMGMHTYLLDGDNIRHGLCKDLGFSDSDRKENIRRIAEVAKLFADAGLIVITAFISPFRADRAFAAEILENCNFVEVFVDAPVSVCEQRDPKGLYKKARAGQIKGFTGIDSPYEPPFSPDIRIDTSKVKIEDSVEIIRQFLLNKDILG